MTRTKSAFHAAYEALLHDILKQWKQREKAVWLEIDRKTDRMFADAAQMEIDVTPGVKAIGGE